MKTACLKHLLKLTSMLNWKEKIKENMGGKEVSVYNRKEFTKKKLKQYKG